MVKLPQQLQVVQSSQSHNQPIRCHFCGGDHPKGCYSHQNNSSKRSKLHGQPRKARRFLQQ